MNSPHGFLQKTIDVESRTFSLKILEFDNGYFISVSEGNPKLGSMVVSLATGPMPITTTVIPARTESLFLKLTAERISTKMRGITIVSANIQTELDPSIAKSIMSSIMEMIRID